MAALTPATDSMTVLVAALIVHDPETDRVLLLQRGPRAKFARGRWDLPVGKNDPGEPVTATAVRELYEETGLTVDPADLRLAHVVHGAHGAEAPHGFLTVVFAVRRWSGTPVNREPAKHSQVCWVPVGEVPEHSFPPAAEAIARYRAGEHAALLAGWA